MRLTAPHTHISEQAA